MVARASVIPELGTYKGDFEKWAEALVAALHQEDEEALNVLYYDWTEAAVTLNAGGAWTEVAAKQIGATAAPRLVEFSCAILLQSPTSISIQITKDAAELYAAEQVFSSAGEDYGSICVRVVCQCPAGQTDYAVNMRVDGGGTAEVTRRLLTLTEFRET